MNSQVPSSKVAVIADGDASALFVAPLAGEADSPDEQAVATNASNARTAVGENRAG